MLALSLPMALMAQEKKESTGSIPQSETVVRMAAELSKYGYANNDALSLIQAARLVKQANMVQVKTEKTEEQGQESVGEKKGDISLDAAKLLADAKAKAGNNGTLLALIDEVETTRGATNGPRYNRTSVKAKGTDVYRISFRAGEIAIITAIGDGDTDLDLYVYDENGNLIEKDVDYSDDCVVTFTPRWTGVFVIKVVNRGNVYNNYVLRTN
mgnify:FL=1